MTRARKVWELTPRETAPGAQEPRKASWSSFLNGYCASVAYTMFLQDWMGKEGYLATVRVGWVNTPVWLGAALLVLFVGAEIGAHIRARRGGT